MLYSFLDHGLLAITLLDPVPLSLFMCLPVWREIVSYFPDPCVFPLPVHLVPGK
jgi:hypothetical protein